VALDFARRFRATLQQQEISSRIGIDYGDVLVFQLREGVEDIAGAPVNIASKLAQDEGVFGKISLTDAAVSNARAGSEFNKVSFQISGVTIDAWMD
jgi:class 3 adenylate cyclase